MSRVYRSRNGSPIPNPFVDNAKPHQSLRTWATVNGAHTRVYVSPLGGRRANYVAHVSGTYREAYGIGPGDAVRNLDKILSARRNG